MSEGARSIRIGGRGKYYSAYATVWCKITAALSRQHPHDMFDIKHMTIPIEQARLGVLSSACWGVIGLFRILCAECVSQREAMENQLADMSDVPFTYDD